MQIRAWQTLLFWLATLVKARQSPFVGRVEMKFYIRLLVIMIAIVAVLWLLQEFGPELSPQGGPTPSATSSPPEAAAPGATSAGAGQASASLPPANPPAPSSSSPSQQPVAYAPPVAATPEDAAIAKFRQMAQQAGVELVGFQRDGDWFVVTIRTPERNRLFDFLDVAQRFGLKNVDVKRGPQMREYMGPGGRLYFEATHRMRF